MAQDKVPVVDGSEAVSKQEAKDAVEMPGEEEEEEMDSYFGDLVPFGDPYWYQDWASPFYNNSHRRLRAAMRKIVDEEISPNVAEWDDDKKLPTEFIRSMGEKGILGGVLGEHWWTEYAGSIKPPGGVKPEEWDGFHSFIVCDEIARCGSGGTLWGLLGGLGIGLPPVLRFGSDEMRKRVGPGCISGEKRICLAITEPSGGSDVANLATTAEKTSDGKHYIVNGEKKWITNGVTADYFTVAVRTGGKGFGGISLLLVERGMEGLETRQMNCTGVFASGTSYVTFEDVKVPVENLIGSENKGFQLIMANFNHERIGIAMQANRFSRVLLEECIVYGGKRTTFGTQLREHPVIRNKLAHMARKIEATHAWIEQVIYQSKHYSEDDLMLRGGGQAALLKAQIFGGLCYTKGGQGEKVERIAREVRAYTIPGGSLEIMLDLGVKQSIKIAEIMGAKI